MINDNIMSIWMNIRNIINKYTMINDNIMSIWMNIRNIINKEDFFMKKGVQIVWIPF